MLGGILLDSFSRGVWEERIKIKEASKIQVMFFPVLEKEEEGFVGIKIKDKSTFCS